MTVVAGIDEAGYGPRLGPLVVAATAFRLGDGVREAALDRLVRISAPAGGLAIGDSKQLYAGPHALGPLETSVLGHVVLGRGSLPLRVGALLDDAVDFGPEDVEHLPWYGPELLALPLPRDAGIADVLARTERQAELLADRGLVFEGLYLAPVPEARFNQLTRLRGSKAWPLFLATGRLLDRLIERFPTDELLVRIDHHGSRRRYGELLAGFFPLAPIETQHETPTESAYRLRFPGRPELRIRFEVRADGRRAPVALASMAAKTVRELFMLRLNRWFAEQVPGVRPTAGYPGDAGRFLDEVSAAIASPGVREHLVRLR